MQSSQQEATHVQWLKPIIITCLNRAMHPVVVKDKFWLKRAVFAASSNSKHFFFKKEKKSKKKFYSLLSSNSWHISLQKTLLCPAITQPLTLETLKLQETQFIFCVVRKELASQLPWKLDLLLGRKPQSTAESNSWYMNHIWYMNSWYINVLPIILKANQQNKQHTRKMTHMTLFGGI